MTRDEDRRVPPTFTPLATAGLGIDRFRGRIEDLPAHGLDPILVTDNLPGEIWLQPCLVVCRKSETAR